jgi:hypothetical protein
MECRLAGETEGLGENLPQRHFVHHKIPHDQTRFWTRAAAVGSRRLTSWGMARPPVFQVNLILSEQAVHKQMFTAEQCRRVYMNIPKRAQWSWECLRAWSRDLRVHPMCLQPKEEIIYSALSAQGRQAPYCKNKSIKKMYFLLVLS